MSPTLLRDTSPHLSGTKSVSDWCRVSVLEKGRSSARMYFTTKEGGSR